MKNFYREAIVWHQLKHQSILPFLGIDIRTSKGNPPKPRMVSPWMSHGNVIETARHLKSDRLVEEGKPHSLSTHIPQWVRTACGLTKFGL